MKAIHPTRVPDRIAQILEREIQVKGLTGKRLGSVRELATRFSVSTTTLSQALAILTSQGLIERRHGSGTYVCDRQARQHVAVLMNMDLSHPRASYFWTRTTHQLRERFLTDGFRVKVYLGRYSPDEPAPEITCADFEEDLRNGKLCGVVALYSVEDKAWIARLLASGVPVVGPTDDYPYSVQVEGGHLVRRGTEILLQHGRCRIAYLGWQGFRTREDLYWPSFVEVMKKAKASIEEDWVRRDLHPTQPGAGWEEFREIWSNRSKRPDGLLVTDDVLFRDVATAVLEQRVRVPEELLIVTHANKGSDIIYPFPVVRLQFDPDEFARETAAMLVALMRHQKVVKPSIHVPFQVVEDDMHREPVTTSQSKERR